MNRLNLKKRTIEAFTFLVVSTICILSIFPQNHFLSRWCEPYVQHFMFLFLGVGMLYFLLSKKRLMVIYLAGCAALCLFLNERTQSPLRMAGQSDGMLIKVAQLDLSQIGATMDSMLAMIVESEADLISLQKVAHRDIPRIINYLSCCGYDFFHSPSEVTGLPEMIIFSKYPFADVKNVYFADAANIVGKICVSPRYPSLSFHFINSALALSDSPDSYNLLRENLSIIANQSGRIETPLMVFGNYHLVPWSKELNHFQEATGLKNSHRQVVPSRPNGRVTLMDAPGNHILYSHHFKCISFEAIKSVPYRRIGIVGTYELTRNADPDVKETSQKL